VVGGTTTTEQEDNEMTTKLITRKGDKMELDGNIIIGNTYKTRAYLKTFCDAKWDKERKGWIVDTEKLNNILAMNNSIGLRIDN
jgi:hypothetical protein